MDSGAEDFAPTRVAGARPRDHGNVRVHSEMGLLRHVPDSQLHERLARLGGSLIVSLHPSSSLIRARMLLS